MEQVFLSDIDLFYSNEILNESQKIKLVEEEFNHAVKVMRKNVGDSLFITDGNGKIYQTEIEIIEKKNLISKIIFEYNYKNSFSNFTFCLPILKNKERQEFALEKCIELGFTNFIYYSSEKSFKSNLNLNRTNKIALAAMKQSLQSFIPKINFISELKNLSKLEDEIIYFDQKGESSLKSFLNDPNKLKKKIIFVIGSESGFSENEQKFLNEKKSLILSNNRLRSETASIYAAILVNAILQKD